MATGERSWPMDDEQRPTAASNGRQVAVGEGWPMVGDDGRWTSIDGGRWAGWREERGRGEGGGDRWRRETVVGLQRLVAQGDRRWELGGGQRRAVAAGGGMVRVGGGWWQEMMVGGGWQL